MTALTLPVSGLPSVANAKLPVMYEAAKDAIAACARIDECKEWADKAAALASYAKQADDDALHKAADRIRARAILRCGELLRQIEPAKGGDRGGGRPSKDGNQHAGTGAKVSRSQAARDAGLSKRQKDTALAVASVPEPLFEKLVEGDEPPTVTKLAEMGTKPKAKPLDLEGRSAKDLIACREALVYLGDLVALVEKSSIASIASIVRGASPKERARIAEMSRVLTRWLGELQSEVESQ